MLRPHAQPKHARRTAWSARRIAGAIALVAAIALPWTWFVVRDASRSMDAVSVGLPAAALVVTIGGLAAAAVWSRPFAAAVALSFLVVGVVAIVEPRTPERAGPPLRSFRLVAANVYEGNRRPRDAARAIAAAEPQVVVAVETPDATVRALVAEFHSYHHEGRGDLGVYAAWPVRSLGAVPGVPAANAIRVEVLRPDAPFVIYAIHLTNPLVATSFDEQLEVVEAVIASAGREDLPVVLAGDFNVGDRSLAYRRLHETFRDAMRSTWASSTYDHGAWIALQLRIDHVFVSRDLCSAAGRVLTVPGSDHDAVRVQLGACP